MYNQQQIQASHLAGLNEQQRDAVLCKADIVYVCAGPGTGKTMLLTDTQIGLVANAYYHDQNFCKSEDGSIDLWRVFNLFTGANKSSYIDNFLDRAENATALTSGLCMALYGDPEYSWFLS